MQKYTSVHTNKAEIYMDKLFPVGNSVSTTKYAKLQKAEAHKHHKLSKSDLEEFMVPVQIMSEFSEVLRPTKIPLRKFVMNAMGIATEHRSAKISYDQFLKLNSFLRFNKGSQDDYIWFCVRLFDPQLQGFTEISHCEKIIELLFENQDEEGTTTKPPPVKLP